MKVKAKKAIKKLGRALSVTVLTAVMGLSGGCSSVKTAKDFSDVNNGSENKKLTLTEEKKLKAADTSAAFDKNTVKENGGEGGERWLLVTLDDGSLADIASSSLTEYSNSSAGKRRAAEISAEQEKLLKRMKQNGIPYEYKYGYTVLSNAVAIKCDVKYIDKIENMSGVKDVSVSEYYYAPQDIAVTNNANVWGTGIYKVDDDIAKEYNGRGMLLAVLDTGLDASHPAFQTMPTDATALVDKDTVGDRLFGGSGSGRLANGATVNLNEIYYNEKVPFAYDYADNDPDVYPSYSSHGTHVAGIMAGTPILGANGEPDYIRDQDGNLILDKNEQPMTFTGVAPQAQLAIFKVFTDSEYSDQLGGAETVDILAALEDCVKLGVDVINMSLGSSAGFSHGDDAAMQTVYENVRKAGISLVVAASNDYSSAYNGTYGTNLTTNPDSATVGWPSTFPDAMSVASINGQQAKYIRVGNDANARFLYFTEASDGNGNQKDFIKELIAKNPELKDGNGDIELDYVVVPGYGLSGNYSQIDVTGKVAVVRRGGEVTFEDKVRVAKQRGAIACVIYNNVSGVIRMSLGALNDPIPTCSITMDAANGFISAQTGKLYVNEAQKAGPFMSDFSSWGPTPDLRLKPEISAHGGEITSSVANGWDEYSGTSMASPNMAGAMALILGYVDKNIAYNATADNKNEDRVAQANRLLMSTATIARDEFGYPYSPRKQGAGLADIGKAMSTKAYIFVDGSDKTKLELFDDPERTGEYTLSFKVRNLSDSERRYTLGTQTMTETIASDGITVAERAYMLDALSDITYSGDGVTGNTLVLPANSDASVTVKIRLNAAAKKYIEDNFKNGMYVEGFATLTDISAADRVDLNIPWLGFYGDWYASPMFDISEYELSAALQNDGIPDDEKPKAAIYPTVPLGSYRDDQYIIPLGTYLYDIPTQYRKIYSASDKAALSIYDEEGHRTVNELYAIYAGMLRGAEEMNVKITDAVTGETVLEKTVNNVRKAYTGGASTARAAFVEMKWSPAELGLENNKQYLFHMDGKLASMPTREYDPSEYGYNKSFDFNFYIDTEAPEIVDYRVRYDTYKDSDDKTRYNVYLDVDVYDNHYSQSIALCFADYSKMSLELLNANMVPLYSTRNSVTTVTLDITDYYDKNLELYLQVDDYALNTRAYRVNDFKSLIDAVQYPETVEITNAIPVDGGEYAKEIIIDINQAFKLETAVTPVTAANVNLYWHSFDTETVTVNDGEIFGVSKGDAVVRVYAGKNEYSDVYDTVLVHVTDDVRTDPNITRLKLGLITNKDDAQVNPTNATVEVHPNRTIALKVEAEPWYVETAPVMRWSSSSPEIASVNPETGVVRTLSEGSATIQGTMYVDGRPTPYSVSTVLSVGPDFYIQSGYLRGYYGKGGKVTIPKSLNVYYIYEEAFQDNDNIVELEISSPCTEIQPYAFANMKALRRVVLPDTISYVYRYAFYGCTNLEQIDLHSRWISFGTACFAGCTSLKYINNVQLLHGLKKEDVQILDLEENTDFLRISAHLTSISDETFRGCSALSELDITQLRVAGRRAFADCGGLTRVILSRFTAMGDEMFKGCSKLSELVYTDVTSGDLGAITYDGVASPFAGCNITKITFSDSATYASERADDVQVLYTDDKKTLVRVGQNATSFTVPATVTTIAANAFSGNSRLESVAFESGSSLLTIGNYAFADTGIKSITLPQTVKTLGTGAFSGNSSLEAVDLSATQIETLPDRAFYRSNLSRLSLPAGLGEIGAECFYGAKIAALDLTATQVTKIGDRAFAECSALQNVSLGDIAELGRAAFAVTGGGELKSVTFGSGSTTLGSYTFSGQSNLQSLDLPAITTLGSGVFRGCSSLTEVPLRLSSVGASAFEGCVKLTDIDLSALVDAGERAFSGCEKLATERLDKAVTIGDYAFYNCGGITRIELPEAESIGAYAFVGSSVSSVNMPKIKSVGGYAFAKTPLIGTSGTLNLPSGIENIGEGAFSSLAHVSAFAIDNNDKYSAIDGVLYLKVPNGYTLIAYPAGKGGTVRLVDGTVRVAASAFENATLVTAVEFPYEFAAVGNRAFFGCGATLYTFGCLSAPVLETESLSASDFEEGSDMYKLFDDTVTGDIATEKYYANFKNYVALVIYAGKGGVTGIKDLGLALVCPENAVGFDGRIYSHFFSVRERSDVIADANARAARSRIAELKSANAVEGIKSLTAADTDKRNEYRTLLTAAREAYNAVIASQRAFVDNAEYLFEAEAAMRDKASLFGESVTRERMYVFSNPVKMRYVRGEKFDPAGLALVVVWSDGSLQDITSGYTVANSGALTEANRTVRITYEGLSVALTVTVEKPEVQSLAIENNPVKLVYAPDERFSTSGLILAVTYVDGIKELLYNGYTVDVESWELGENTVTFGYAGKTVSLTVTVKEDEPDNPPSPVDPGKKEDKGCRSYVSGCAAFAATAVFAVALVIIRRNKRSV